MTYELITTVYLNQGDYQTLGFGELAPPKLAAAAGFVITMTGHPSTEHVKTALETVFEQLNIDDPDQPWAIKYRLAAHRSLSVGDVVVIGETAWACAPSGWDLLTAEQLHDALYH
ncbi:hypothetical protein [Mycolicibacterium chlorophenolicum]|uniref:Uncharacterized protein n=1 Tax=Mycolicibacterium chlorophenolicum TaxID=37916 RepID=A0A0J6VK52_9MYCO|nr:hypothetical protein [Mycolicibacterium chlorophenolicum]KMO69838.1 hypothetical protein MCHLDSM_05950 [Mycolicibacterium chlorophenolicum]